MQERNQDIFELIEAYLNGGLNAEEQREFEARLETDPQLREELLKHKELHIALADTSTLEFRKKIHAIQEDYRSDQKSMRSAPWKIAAVILVLIGLGFLIWNSTSGGNQNLYDQYYTPYPLEDTMRSADDASANVLELYNTGAYKEAIPGLRKLVREDPDNSLYQLYLGISLLEIEETDQAIALFRAIGPENPQYETALWYLSLAHIKNDDLDLSEAVLKAIIEYNGIYRDRAESLLSELENNSPDDS